MDLLVRMLPASEERPPPCEEPGPLTFVETRWEPGRRCGVFSSISRTCGGR